MKKLVALFLTLALLVSLSAMAFANNGDPVVRLVGNGKDTRVEVTYRDVTARSANRPANNAWTTVVVGGYNVGVRVQGNSVRDVVVHNPSTPIVQPGTGEPDIINSGAGTPNQSSGGRGVQRINNVEIRGNGGSARIYINGVNTGVRPDNNRYTTVPVPERVTLDEPVGAIEVFVRGNAILSWRVAGPVEPVPYVPYVPTVVEEYSFYRFVRLNQVDSRFVGTSEVADSREFVNGAAVKYNWVRTNEIPGVSGMGVISGARVTGTLSYQYVRNYVEQFEQVYEWVDVTVWSNGDRDEVVRPGSEHVRGGLVDGDAVFTGPYAGSRAIDVTSGQVILHMGHGQSDAHGRFVSIGGGFTLALELHNTGNPPTITVTITAVDLAAL